MPNQPKNKVWIVEAKTRGTATAFISAPTRKEALAKIKAGDDLDYVDHNIDRSGPWRIVGEDKPGGRP
jgi:hypothetical protein